MKVLRGMANRKRKQTFKSLTNRNYRLYFFALVISASGQWVQIIAENWLVLQITGGSGLMLGITTSIQFTPLLLFSLYAGVLVDRFDKRTLLIFTSSISSILALTLGVLALTGLIEIWMIWISAFLQGCLNALSNPARQVFTKELVGKGNVTNAVALNNTVSTSARVIGPAIGGVLISIVGIAVCFLINAFAYLAVILGLYLINKSKMYFDVKTPRKSGQIREGLRYVWHHSTLRTVILIMFVTSTFGLNFQVLLPLFTTHTFQQGSESYGTLMSSLGIGAVLGSLIVASWENPTMKRVAWLSLVFGTTNAAVAFSPNLTVALITVAMMGVATSLFLTSCAGCLQENTDGGMRGRVMALYTVAFLGTGPIGGTSIGWIAELWGPRAGFLISAIACISASGLIFLSRTDKSKCISQEGKEV